MNLIELHIIQSFPVTCLNRDDVGAPKSALFGGVQRARVSSQCWKRAIRELAKEEQPSFFGGNRTRYIISDLKDKIIEKFDGSDEKNEEKAQILANAIADGLGKLDSIEKGNVKTMLYVSQLELQNIVNKMFELDFPKLLNDILDESNTEKQKEKLKKELNKLAEKAAKDMKNAVKDTADISLFGRMVADDHSLMLEGATNFSHALSTHKVSSEIDFFSAVDDNMPSDVEGAGHIGTLEFNSACYYRYIGLNLDLLKDSDHLQHFSDEELNSVISSFIKATILAVPSARKNSMFGFNPPEYVLGLKRTGQPLSLANAFENPVRAKNGYVEPSITEMKNKFESFKSTFGLNIEKEISIPEKNIDNFISELLPKTNENDSNFELLPDNS